MNELSYKASCAVGSATDVGVVRTENQDCIGYFQASDNRWTLLVVCDGMGGHAGGQRASALCTDVVSKEFASRIAHMEPGVALGQAIRAANSAVFSMAMAEPELRGMGTTCAALAATDTNVYIAHVGDSRIYRVRPGSVELLTRDHSAVQRMVDGGILTPEQASAHPESNVLIRCVGGEADVEPESRGPEVILSGDRFVLCSDGLWSLVQGHEIAGMASAFTAQDAVERLIRLAKSRGGPDNISVQIYHRDDGHPPTNTYSPEKFMTKAGATVGNLSIDTEDSCKPRHRAKRRWLNPAVGGGVALVLSLAAAVWWWSQDGTSTALIRDNNADKAKTSHDAADAEFDREEPALKVEKIN
jgi:serine/threonine protein phosphatase PrpC